MSFDLPPTGITTANRRNNREWADDAASSDDDNEEDPFRRLHNNPFLTCISDRVDQELIFPYLPDGPLLDEVVQTIVGGTSVLVVGEPGIGKRTLSLGLARRLHEMRGKKRDIEHMDNDRHKTKHQKPHMSSSVANRYVYTLSLGREFWAQPKGDDEYDNDDDDDMQEEGNDNDNMNNSDNNNKKCRDGGGVSGRRCRNAAIQNGIRQVFRDVEKAGPEKLVLCIDDLDMLNFIDTLVIKEHPLNERDNTEPILSTENMLRFLLFNKKILCLCTCISAAHTRLVYLDTFYDEKFSESFRVIHMREPSLRHSFGIVRAHRQRIEAELDVIVMPDAVDAAIAASVTFATHRRMPEKGLELLSEACGMAVKQAEGMGDGDVRETLHVGGRVIVERGHVSQVVQEWCGVTKEQLERCYEQDRFSL